MRLTCNGWQVEGGDVEEGADVAPPETEEGEEAGKEEDMERPHAGEDKGEAETGEADTAVDLGKEDEPEVWTRI